MAFARTGLTNASEGRRLARGPVLLAATLLAALPLTALPVSAQEAGAEEMQRAKAALAEALKRSQAAQTAPAPALPEPPPAAVAAPAPSATPPAPARAAVVDTDVSPPARGRKRRQTAETRAEARAEGTARPSTRHAERRSRAATRVARLEAERPSRRFSRRAVAVAEGSDVPAVTGALPSEPAAQPTAPVATTAGLILPVSLAPSGGLLSTNSSTVFKEGVGWIQGTPEVLSAASVPLSDTGGSRPRDVAACRDAINALAGPRGATEVQVAGNGRGQSGRAGSATPLQVRVTYKNGLVYEVKQASITCDLDRSGRVVALSADALQAAAQ